MSKFGGVIDSFRASEMRQRWAPLVVDRVRVHSGAACARLDTFLYGANAQSAHRAHVVGRRLVTAP